MEIGTTKTSDKPEIITGGLHVDARGIVTFVNDFDFKGVDRFYTIQNHQANTCRGWIGHRREQKWFTVVQGSMLIAVVRPDHWELPASSLSVSRWVISALKPQVLHVPAGHATANVNLTDDAILLVFSSGRTSESVEDDFRFPSDTWTVIE